MVAVVIVLTDVEVDHSGSLVVGGLIWLKMADTLEAKRAGGARMSEIEAKRRTATRTSFEYRGTARAADYHLELQEYLISRL